MTMTPRIASDVLLRLASEHQNDPEILEAVTLATKRLTLRPGCSMVAVVISSRGPIAPGGDGEAYGRPFCTLKPCWIEINDHDHWRVERWFLGSESQPVAPLFTGGNFPTAKIGRDIFFRIRNIGTEAADFHAELVGYGYQHRWPTMRRSPHLIPLVDD